MATEILPCCGPSHFRNEHPVDVKILFWVECQRCGEILTSSDLSEVVRLFARHEFDDHAQASPHLPEAGFTRIKPRV